MQEWNRSRCEHIPCDLGKELRPLFRNYSHWLHHQSFPSVPRWEYPWQKDAISVILSPSHLVQSLTVKIYSESKYLMEQLGVKHLSSLFSRRKEEKGKAGSHSPVLTPWEWLTESSRRELAEAVQKWPGSYSGDPGTHWWEKRSHKQQLWDLEERRGKAEQSIGISRGHRYEGPSVRLQSKIREGSHLVIIRGKVKSELNDMSVQRAVGARTMPLEQVRRGPWKGHFPKLMVDWD